MIRAPEQPDAAPAIAVQGLTKSFGGRRVVDGVSMTVAGGEIAGFLGPNGSGKTTCIRMMCGLLTPDAGGGTVLGLDRERARDARDRLEGDSGVSEPLQDVCLGGAERDDAEAGPQRASNVASTPARSAGPTMRARRARKGSGRGTAKAGGGTGRYRTRRCLD